MIRIFYSILLLFFSGSLWAQVDCNDDHTFYPARGNRAIPAVGCDTVYLITSRHYRKLFVEKDLHDSIVNTYKTEVLILNHLQQDLIELSARHKSHIDSLDHFITEKDMQLTRLDSLANTSVRNTDRALHIARTNKILSYITIAVSAMLLVFTNFN